MPDAARLPVSDAERSLARHAPPAFVAADFSGDAQFIVMLEAFRPHGGLARLRELSTCARQWAGPGRDAALRDPGVLRFDWAGETWVPLFQFLPALLVLRPEVQQVVDALRRCHDGWQVATWFARPCAALRGATPVARLADDRQAVLEAARRKASRHLN